jgi:hypothetical protein
MAKVRKIQTSVTLPADIVARLHEESFGDSLSAVIADRLRQALKMGPRPQAEASPMEALDERKKVAETEMVERRAAILRGEYVRRDEALAVVARDYATIASRLNNIPQSLIGATPEQVDDLKKIVADCMTDLSAENPAAWDDLVDEASRNPP